jgi:hypothetical protein
MRRLHLIRYVAEQDRNSIPTRGGSQGLHLMTDVAVGGASSKT